MAAASALILGLLPVVLAGSGLRSRVQLDVAPALTLRAGVASTQVTPIVALAATAFLAPLVDDATPLPLQPFLQRTSTIAVRLDGALPPHEGAVGDERAVAGGLTIAADVYARRWLAFVAFAGVAAGATSPAGAVERPIRFGFALALRTGDARLELGFRYAPSALATSGPPEGSSLRGDGALTLAIRAVLIGRIDVGLRLAVAASGDWVGDFSGDYHPSRRLALLWGLSFGHGALAGAPVIEEVFGGHFGLGFWWSPRVGLAGRYEPLWRFSGTVEQRFTVAIATRL